MRLKFDNEKQFVEYVISRADHSPDIIVGLGIRAPRSLDGYEMFSSGCFIAGYFYKNGKFCDHFSIRENGCRYGSKTTAEINIKDLRKVTDVFYYKNGRK